MAAVRSKLRRIPGKLGRMARRALGVPRGPAILMYHRIGQDDIDPWGLAVSADRFDEQLGWLKRHRIVLPLAEFARAHCAGKLPRRAIAITFDDGYACNATVAAPLLTAQRLPATIFVTTGPVADGREFWWDDLQRIVFATTRTRLDLIAGGQALSFELGGWKDRESWAYQHPPATVRQEAFMAIWRALRALEAPEQSAALARLREQAAVPEGARDSHRPMTRDEMRALGQSGLIDIGAHSITHAALGERDEASQREEIEGSRRACAAITGRTPTSFAYPFGDYTAATVELVRAAGFEAACTTDTATVTARNDVMALPRLQVEDWSARQLAGALSAL